MKIAYVDAFKEGVRFRCMVLRIVGVNHVYLCAVCGCGAILVNPGALFFSAGPCPACGAACEAVTECGRVSCTVIEARFEVVRPAELQSGDITKL